MYLYKIFFIYNSKRKDEHARCAYNTQYTGRHIILFCKTKKMRLKKNKNENCEFKNLCGLQMFSTPSDAVTNFSNDVCRRSLWFSR